MSGSKPDVFELKVMQLALRGNNEWRRALREQLPHLRVVQRKLTGAGFYTDFQSVGGSPAVIPAAEPAGQSYPPTVNAKRSNPFDGLVSFIVWVDENGYIRQLEACSLTDGYWPEDPFAGFHDFQDDAGHLL